MSPALKLKKVLVELATGSILPLSPEQWLGLQEGFQKVEAIETSMAGKILLLKRPVPGRKRPAWALLEEPRPDQRVLRPLASENEARALIKDRLAAYERMWDG